MSLESTQLARAQTGYGSRIPHDLDAEMEALGILLAHPAKLDGARVGGLDTDCFYPRHHRAIFRAINELGAERTPADSAAVADRLTANHELGELAAYEGVHYLIALGRDILGPDSLAYVIPRLRQLATGRAAMLSTAVTPFRSAAERVPELWNEPPPCTIATGIAPLDLALGGGFMAESMAVLCAGTGRGKTGLVIQIARHWLRLGLPVLFIETELSERQVNARFLAQILGQPWRDIFQTGPAGGPALAEHARRELPGLCVWKWKPGQSIAELIDGYAQSLGKSPLVIIDQISDLARAKGVADMRHATASVSAEIKAAAEQHKTVVLAVSQTARAVTADPDKRKAGRSFEGAAKDAGEVEADAGTLLYLETLPSPRQGAALARIHVAKSRGGPCGEVVVLHFHGALNIFEPPSVETMQSGDRALLDALTGLGGPVGVKKLAKKLRVGQETLEARLAVLSSLVVRDKRGISLASAAGQPCR